MTGKKYTMDEIGTYVSENSGCKIVSNEYINTKTLMKFTCEIKSCSNNFETTFQSFKFQNKHVCDECGRKIADERRKNTQEDVYNYILETGCELISEYKGTRIPLKIKCGCCGKIFFSTLDAYKYKKHKRCIKCNRKISDGEIMLEELLKLYNIEYIHQYGFSDCKYKNKLNFDFYLKNFNTLIEIDGRQHRVIIEYFGGKEEFDEIQARDKTKNDYCKKHSIPLIRIDYDGIHKDEFTEQCNKEIKSILNTSVA